MKEIVIVANGVYVGVLSTNFSCEKLKEIFDSESPVHMHIYEEVK